MADIEVQNSETAFKKSAYNADDLSSLKGLEAVRKKPGMYIGGTDERALHHCVSEVLDNSVDEFLAGHCTHIRCHHSQRRFAFDS
jgi:DNA gyrase subunit B